MMWNTIHPQQEDKLTSLQEIVKREQWVFIAILGVRTLQTCQIRNILQRVLHILFQHQERETE